uniref:Uncharacterized protein n=1 Tax=Lactuca sativa TaxID=4236 RepID=A0A9R1XW52_LACSA|nr:hypothetical protein LSAT_V11C100026880 [Lactuca sativa]
MKMEEISTLSVIINIHAHVMERFPCSHALVVCGFRGDNHFSIINHVYTTVKYKKQYNDMFSPLTHVDYWLEANWSIQPDNSQCVVG